MALGLEERDSDLDKGKNPPPNPDTCESEPEQIESLFDLAKCGFWSGEAIPGPRRPALIRVCTACSITAK